MEPKKAETKTEKILQQLISIPSYVDQKTDEGKIGDFVCDYLARFSHLRIERQNLGGQRANIIVRTPGIPNLLIAAHLDTVEPKTGWASDQFLPQINNDKLYGLGAVDTKGGIAALLVALGEAESASGVTALFYCDEEYHFAGMKHFLANEPKSSYTLAIVTEPTDLKIWNAHRGLIQVRLIVRGKTGHAANPESGINAIKGLANVLRAVEHSLKKWKTRELKQSTMNLAFMRGGLDRGARDDRGETILGSMGNNIADYAEAVVEVRSANSKLNGQKLSELLHQACAKENLKIEKIQIELDLQALVTEKKKLRPLELLLKNSGIKVSYLDPAKKGYSDGQLISEKWNLPVAYLGPSGGNMHGVNEWVSLDSLRLLGDFYRVLLKRPE